MRVKEGQEKSYFHPNKKFEDYIAKQGFAYTGITTTGKPKISYNPEILNVLNKPKHENL